MAEHTVLGATTGRAFLLPLDEIIVAGLSPGIKFTGIHLVERGTVKVKSLSLNTTGCPQPGLKFKPLNEANAPATKTLRIQVFGHGL